MKDRSHPRVERAKLSQRLLLNSLKKSLKAHEIQQSALEGKRGQELRTLKSIQRRMADLAAVHAGDEEDSPQDASAFSRVQAATRHKHGAPAASRHTGDDWVFYMGHLAPDLDDLGVEVDEAPLLQLLPSGLGEEFKQNFKRSQLAAPWTEWDYGIVAISVLVATISDYFLTVAPNGRFRGERQSRSAITSWLKEQASPLANYHTKSPVPKNAFQEWVVIVNTLAKRWEQPPFDVLSPNEALTANLRRAARQQSDPVLCLVVCIMDVVSGRCIFRDWKGKWNEINQLPGQSLTLNVPEAILKLILYGLSDVLLPENLPVMYSGLPQLLANASSTAEHADSKSIPFKEMLWQMSEHGYSLHGFARQPFRTAVAELVLSAYHAVRAICGTVNPKSTSVQLRLKREQMLQLTLTLISSASVVGTGLYGWDPTKSDPREFAALSTRMLTVMRSVQERNQQAKESLIRGWQDLATDLFF